MRSQGKREASCRHMYSLSHHFDYHIFYSVSVLVLHYVLPEQQYSGYDAERDVLSHWLHVGKLCERIQAE